jgi:hypothetical protein
MALQQLQELLNKKGNIMNITEKSKDVKEILLKTYSSYELNNLLSIKRIIKNDIERLLDKKDIDLNTLKAIQYLLQQA